MHPHVNGVVDDGRLGAQRRVNERRKVLACLLVVQTDTKCHTQVLDIVSASQLWNASAEHLSCITHARTQQMG